MYLKSCSSANILICRQACRWWGEEREYYKDGETVLQWTWPYFNIRLPHSPNESRWCDLHIIHITADYAKWVVDWGLNICRIFIPNCRLFLIIKGYITDGFFFKTGLCNWSGVEKVIVEGKRLPMNRSFSCMSCLLRADSHTSMCIYI